MVVQGIIALALALPTGMLFGLGYGTGVRIGYEQVYPLLFPKTEGSQPDAKTLQTNMKQINSIYNTIGGKEASNMGIAQGLNNARSELENNPDFQWLEALESNLSGHTQSNLNQTPTGNFDSTTSSALQESFNAQSPAIQSQATTIRQITDIPSLMRLLDRENVKPIPSPYIQATIKARINLLRGSQTQLTPQEHNQQQLDNRQPPPIIPAPTRAPTKTETALSTYQQGVHNLLIPILKYKNEISSLTARAKAMGTGGSTVVAKPKATAKKNLASAQKRLQNHITHARNNPMTKSRANSDWNARIWQ